MGFFSSPQAPPPLPLPAIAPFASTLLTATGHPRALAIARALPSWADWCVTLVLAQCALHLLLRVTGLVSGRTTSRDGKRQLTDRALFAAYLVVSTVAVALSSVIGYNAFISQDLEPLWANHMYGFHPSAQQLGNLMTGYQVYNLAMCAVIAEYRTAETLAHHVSTAVLSWCVDPLNGGYANLYCLFFVGVAETSSVPLTVVDAAKYFPELKKIGWLQMGAKLSFGLTFFLFRVAVWPVVSFFFQKENTQYILGTHPLLLDGTVAAGKPQMWMLVMFGIGNAGLTVLQFVWAAKIIKMVQRMGKKKD